MQARDDAAAMEYFSYRVRKARENGEDTVSTEGLWHLNQPRAISSRDDAVAHLDRAHQHQHIEDQLAHIVPYDGGCRQRIVRDGRR